MKAVIRCEDTCIYRNRYAAFCGFCIKKIIDECDGMKGGKTHGQEIKTKGSE